MGTGLGTQISPVLQAFLAGQSQQSDIMEKARNYGLQKEHIDALVKEIENRHKEAQQAHDLAVQQFELAGKQHLFEARQQIMQQLRDNPETAPGTTNFQAPGTNMAIPGMASAQVTPNGVSISRGPGDMIPGQPRQVITPPAAGEMVHMDTPYGTISVPMPKSSVQSKVEEAEATLPTEVKKYNATIGSSKQLQYDTQQSIHQSQIDMLNRYHDLLDKEKDSTNATNLLRAELNNQAALNRQFASFTGFQNPDDVKRNVNQFVAQATTGHLDPTMMATASPAEKEMFRNTMTGLHYQMVDPKTMADIAKKADVGVQSLASTDQYLSDNPAPKNMLGKAAQAAVNAAGLNREYKNYRASTLSNVELALGLPLGRISGNVGALKNYEPLLPQPYEGPETTEIKKNKLADIFVGGLADDLNKYQPEQRKMLIRQILSDNPGIENNKYLSDRMHKFLDTGTFTPQFKAPKVK